MCFVCALCVLCVCFVCALCVLCVCFVCALCVLCARAVFLIHFFLVFLGSSIRSHGGIAMECSKSCAAMLRKCQVGGLTQLSTAGGGFSVGGDARCVAEWLSVLQCVAVCCVEALQSVAPSYVRHDSFKCVT